MLTQNLKVKSQNFNSNLKTNLKNRSYNFSVEIIRFIDGLSSSISSTSISKQLLRSAASIGANIIEAKSSSSRKDFTNFYTHALKSANETKYWLNLLRDTGNFNNNKIAVLISEVGELSNMLASSILTLKNKF